MTATLVQYLLCWAIVGFSSVAAQAPPAFVQNNTFNSTATISPQQQQAGQINGSDAAYAQVALRFEQSNWAGQSVSQPFYTVPASSAGAQFGTLLKVEDVTNTSVYTIPPQTSLSRILFQSETLNGTAVPVSAYVLWPYVARTFKGVHGVPIVAFGHGNSGYFGECAPSHLRDLWYQFHAPFELALAGYAVVAPDYSGLGVTQDANGNNISAQWLTNPAAANDITHAVQAAKSAFPALSDKYVVMGHSQGGGAAWATAIREFVHPNPGYLGTVAVSPFTDFSGALKVNPTSAFALAPGLAVTFSTIFPSFRPRDILTPLGIARLNLLKQLQGCIALGRQILAVDTAKPGLGANKYFKEFDKISSVGGKSFRGPLLVIQGTNDTTQNEGLTSKSVRETCRTQPMGRLQYTKYYGANHIPTLYASRQQWMQYIDDLFSGVWQTAKCATNEVMPLRPIQDYVPEGAYFLEFLQYEYEIS